MPTTRFLNAGSEETSDLTSLFFARPLAGSGAVTSATDQAHTGLRSIKAVSTAGADMAAVVTYDGACADAGTCISFWYRTSSATPAQDTAILMVEQSGDGNSCWGIKQTSSTHFGLWGQTATVGFAVTGTATVAASTWTRLTLSYVVTSTSNFTMKLYVNGVLDATMTNASGTLQFASGVCVFFGLISNDVTKTLPTGGGNFTAWYDDLYTDNRADQTDCGDIRVTAKRPFANGSANNFTTQIGAGSSGYGSGHALQVNERPLSQTNGWSHVVVGSAITEEYNVESVSAGDVDLTGATIVDWQGWVFAKSLTGETASIVVNGSTSNISLTSTAKGFYKAAGAASYPPGAGADIGLVTATTSTTVSLYECGVSVAYTQAAAMSQNFENPRRPAPFKPMGDAFRTGKYQGWR